MFKKILIALIVIAGVFAVIVARQPAHFRIERSATVSAPPAVVFGQVNDLHKWEAWSPWAKLDPNAKTTFEGPTAGVGAGMSWSGNNQVGVGRMTITDSHPNDLIRFKMEFQKPFKATDTAEFTFKPEGRETLVTWSMSGENNFLSKAVSLVMNCDKMVGGQFEKGLASLNTVSQTAKPAPAAKSAKAAPKKNARKRK